MGGVGIRAGGGGKELQINNWEGGLFGALEYGMTHMLYFILAIFSLRWFLLFDERTFCPIYLWFMY